MKTFDTKYTRQRIDSKIMRLPPHIREHLNDRLEDTSISLQRNSEWLKEQGHDISTSAVWRYAKHTDRAARRMKESLAKMKAIVQAIKEDPNADYTMATRIVAMDGLLQRVAVAEDEFLDIPLDKAVSLIGKLTNAETQARRAKHSSKTQMELAFDKMEAELAEAIKSNPKLAKEFQEVMEKARREILPDR